MASNSDAVEPGHTPAYMAHDHVRDLELDWHQARSGRSTPFIRFLAQVTAMYRGRSSPLPPFNTSSSLNLVLSQSSGDIEKIVHVYVVNAASAEMQFIITIEPAAEHTNEYRFFLALKTGPIERPICKPETLKLTMHPRDLRFSVFLFPPKASLPAGCLWAVRVWARANEIDHRLFSEDRLWIGRDPDFYSIEDANFARLQGSTSATKMYKIPLGRTALDLTMRWRVMGNSVYALSLEYDAGGVGRVLFNDLNLKLDCPPMDLDFVIYTLPIPSTPRGASHRVRVWLRIPELAPRFDDTYEPDLQNRICQRIWETEDFKVGHDLDFTALGSRMVMGEPSMGGPSTFTSTSELSMYSGNVPSDHTSSEFLNKKKEAL